MELSDTELGKMMLANNDAILVSDILDKFGFKWLAKRAIRATGELFIQYRDICIHEANKRKDSEALERLSFAGLVY